jgi:hypothetical protein
VHDGIHMLHSQIARYHEFFGWTPRERTSCDELVQEQLLITGDTRTTKETL